MQNNFIIAIDVETTGTEPGSRIIELGAIMMDESGAHLGEFHRLINPGMPLPPDAAKVNQVTEDMLAGAPDAGEAIRDFLEWAEDDVTLIAHNAPFDCGMIAWEAARYGITIPAFPVIDTLDMARAIGETKRNGLQALIDHYEIQRDGEAHRALSDADACRQYFLIAREKKEPYSAAWNSFCEHQYTDDLPGSLSDLPSLVESGQWIQFVYEDGKGEQTTRQITPYGWAQTSTGLMFHGWCHMREARRTFRADRVIRRLVAQDDDKRLQREVEATEDDIEI